MFMIQDTGGQVLSRDSITTLKIAVGDRNDFVRRRADDTHSGCDFLTKQCEFVSPWRISRLSFVRSSTDPQRLAVEVWSSKSDGKMN
jgi:hypothetical protein